MNSFTRIPDAAPEQLHPMPALSVLHQVVLSLKSTVGSLSVIAEGQGFPARVAAREQARCDQAAELLMAFCEEHRRQMNRRSEIPGHPKVVS